VLSIAGSDSGGGAGIQADLKAFAACGVHGMTAITAITAQNTVGVIAVHPIPPEVIEAQVRAVRDDIRIDAVKIGMLGDTQTIQAVSRALCELPAETPVVLDPVMVAESGAQLLEPSARRALVNQLLPRATVVTPNVPEATALLLVAGSPAADDAAAADDPAAADHPDDSDPEVLARAIHALGPGAVVVTGGHREEATDIYYDGRRLETIAGERYPSHAAHGSGCTHSSALAARLAWGDDPLSAARFARQLAGRAVRDGLDEVGAGAGPVDALGIASPRTTGTAASPGTTGRAAPPTGTAGDASPTRPGRAGSPLLT
jgi:hydroxymethylpyrimidine/phosphomethylpyrimidine kinase